MEIEFLRNVARELLHHQCPMYDHVPMNLCLMAKNNQMKSKIIKKCLIETFIET